MAEIVGTDEAIQQAYASIEEQLQVREVLSVWAPTIIRDASLAEVEAKRLALEVKVANPGITDGELQTLVKFGTVVGSLSLRRLFEPFVSDAIVVRYSDDSELDQSDAVRRIAKGSGVDVSSVVG